MKICRLTEADVRDLLGWRYDPPYDVYNLDTSAANDTVAFFLAPDNGYFAVRDAESALVGFCCFGYEGQVPGGDYSVAALDVGVGMRPALAGQGRGHGFVGAVLRHAQKMYAPERLRVTVATFNRRSQRVFMRHGFRRHSSFIRTTGQTRAYVILIKEMGDGSR